MQKLLIATHNQGKLREYNRLLADLPLLVTSLQAEGIEYDVEETGQTFTENACLKARSYATLSGLWTWADDSGLEIDALGGRPGIYSARFAGPDATDKDRHNKILEELRDYDPTTWTARFRCVIAIAKPDGEVHTCEGTVEGMITDKPRGEHGFGLDPIFYLSEFNATMAEIKADVKNKISHRANAAASAKKLLASLLSDS